MSPMTQVGLVGVGLLGAAMAERLRAGGWRVTGCDPDGSRAVHVDTFVAAPGELSGVDAVILCLPDSSVTARVLPLLPVDCLIVDTTTGEPEEMASFGAARPRYLDCTVAASSVQVRRNEATLLVGGAGEVVDSAWPLLAAIGARIFHTGGCGSAARMKLVVNLALGLQRAVLGEALGFAEACGLDAGLALEVLQASPAAAKCMEMKGERMIQGRYGDPDARLRQHHKDVRLILDLAARNAARIPLSRLHAELLAEAEAKGYAESDNSAIRELFRSSNIEPGGSA